MKFTVDELQVIARAAQRVWSEIAYDILTAVGEENGKGVDGATVSKADVIELVLDASRLESQLQRDKQKELATRVETDIYGKDSEVERYLSTDVFKHEVYGS